MLPRRDERPRSDAAGRFSFRGPPRCDTSTCDTTRTPGPPWSYARLISIRTVPGLSLAGGKFDASQRDGRRCRPAAFPERPRSNRQTRFAAARRPFRPPAIREIRRPPARCRPEPRNPNRAAESVHSLSHRKFPMGGRSRRLELRLSPTPMTTSRSAAIDANSGRSRGSAIRLQSIRNSFRDIAQRQAASRPRRPPRETDRSVRRPVRTRRRASAARKSLRRPGLLSGA